MALLRSLLGLEVSCKALSDSFWWMHCRLQQFSLIPGLADKGTWLSLRRPSSRVEVLSLILGLLRGTLALAI